MDKTLLPVPELELTFGLDVLAPTKRMSKQRRSSLFGIAPANASTSPPKKSVKSNYEQELTVEAKQWHSLIKESVNSNAKLASKPLVVSEEDLGPELRAFVNAAPDFAKFQSDSLEFAKLAEFFAFRVHDHREKQADLRSRVHGQLKQSATNLALKHNLIISKTSFDSSTSPDPRN